MAEHMKRNEILKKRHEIHEQLAKLNAEWAGLLEKANCNLDLIPDKAKTFEAKFKELDNQLLELW